MSRLAASARVVMFDRRGTGLSDHTTASGDRLALPQLARDVAAVLDSERDAARGAGRRVARRDDGRAVRFGLPGTHPGARPDRRVTSGDAPRGVTTSAWTRTGSTRGSTRSTRALGHRGARRFVRAGDEGRRALPRLGRPAGTPHVLTGNGGRVDAMGRPLRRPRTPSRPVGADARDPPRGRPRRARRARAVPGRPHPRCDVRGAPGRGPHVLPRRPGRDDRRDPHVPRRPGRRRSAPDRAASGRAQERVRLRLGEPHAVRTRSRGAGRAGPDQRRGRRTPADVPLHGRRPIAATCS